MRPISRCVALGAAVVLVVASGNLVRAHETPGERCAAHKLAAAAKKIAGLTGCDARALRDSKPVDPRCVSRVQNEFTTSWMKIEAATEKIPPKGVGCVTTDDVVTIENKVDAHRVDLQQVLDDVPPNVFSKCAAAKIKAAGKKGACKIDCNEKAIGANPLSFDKPICLARCTESFAKAFSSAEKIRPSPHNGTCFTTGDAAAVEAKVDAFVADVVAELPTTPAAADAPNITEVDPNHGKVGDPITIFGDHLTGLGNAIDVTINGTALATPMGDTQSIGGNVAIGTPTGLGTLVVTTPAGHADTPFTVDAQ